MANCRECGEPTTGRFEAGLDGGPVEYCLKCDDPIRLKLAERRDRLASFPRREMTRSRLLPYLHQFDGVSELLSNSFFMLGDEMGVAKTKQVIDAAQILFLDGIIDRVIVEAPSTVRSVWYRPNGGELATHLWFGLPSVITEYHSTCRQWVWEMDPLVDPAKIKTLRWIITNYDYVRGAGRVRELAQYCSKRTLQVLDESSAIKNGEAAQTKATANIRLLCGRVVLMNGTPIANSPEDMLSQGNIMHPAILDCPSKTQFRARYATMVPTLGAGGRPILDKWGKPVRTVKDWHGLDDIDQRFRPYSLRRMKIDCLDLPEKLPSQAIVVPLTPKTWGIYKEMRDETLAWIDLTVSTSPQAATKVMRLAQITSGILGGVRDVPLGPLASADLSSIESRDSDTFIGDTFLGRRPDETLDEFAADPWGVLEEEDRSEPTHERTPDPARTIYIGREKLDAVLEFAQRALGENPKFKLILWAHWRAEILRTYTELRELFSNSGILIGGQSDNERDHAAGLLDPKSAPSGSSILVGSQEVGGLGLDMTAAHTVVYMSNTYSLKVRLQSEDRPHRSGQRHAVSYYDVVAVGPKGQATIDRDLLRVIARKDDLATRTTAGWRKAIANEDDASWAAFAAGRNGADKNRA